MSQSAVVNERGSIWIYLLVSILRMDGPMVLMGIFP